MAARRRRRCSSRWWSPGRRSRPGAHGSATLTKMSSGWQIELSATGLPHLSNGRYYQAWLKNSAGILVPVGTFNDADKVTLWSGAPVTQFRTLSVTRQQANGNPASSGRRVLTGTITNSGRPPRTVWRAPPYLRRGRKSKRQPKEKSWGPVGAHLGGARESLPRVVSRSRPPARRRRLAGAAAGRAGERRSGGRDQPALSVSGEDPTNADVVGGALIAGKPRFRGRSSASRRGGGTRPGLHPRRLPTARGRPAATARSAAARAPPRRSRGR